ncbi:TetR/AcrR family transcriptional regulator [Clostridium gasigenes]|uniref:DNA-binding transcriptional regulator, AcrR family n=1 Tax=Clostridium gasigenes TaxID=94869 RepID=A0A1H0U5I1_9CLOT|nr:TetR/AcrR family transcriptional regulator [Clostridium gasigenes]MBB6622862.1 TetR/AcrR family transcriptional regulator [Clostridium gasigenes]MBB6714473.1 TetR/AcrR family transcriptional regulator [Clostridium gasigenes]MBU3089370.1 TetR/AcrR family transcriptional regulator [Clostridium gasigenes]MBU3103604.1 TetR/AcrR family transcriptional regulator [Clostridium gasigenes]MBU3108445.1 TetR/AcrR family transcriptional regulator [Clostridium gasigenes]
MNKTKKAIFDSAIKVFSSYGYEGATVEEVAINAGVAKGTLYYHFKGKEDLFNFIIKEGINFIKEEVLEAVIGIKDPIEKMKISATVQLKYVYENKDLFRVIMSQMWGIASRHKEMREQVKTLINITTVGFDEVIAEKHSKGLNSEILGYSFIGVLFSSALYEIINEGQYDHDEIVEKFMNQVRYGIQLKEDKIFN